MSAAAGPVPSLASVGDRIMAGGGVAASLRDRYLLCLTLVTAAVTTLLARDVSAANVVTALAASIAFSGLKKMNRIDQGWKMERDDVKIMRRG
jgi:hypothetical protein